MANLELDVMRSFNLVCEVIKDTIVNNLQQSAVKSEIKISKEDFQKIDVLIRASVDQASRNSARQIQSVLPKKTK